MLFSKINIRTRKYLVKKILFRNFLILEIIKIKHLGKFNTYYNFFPSCKPKFNQRVFYLKVHKVHMTSFECIKYWINIAKNMNAFIYFVCDNPQMYYNICQNIIFPNKNFSFIKSDRISLKKEVTKILKSDKKWTRIAYSILTPFIHAHKNHYHVSYNIDADDIQILNNPKQITQALKITETNAIKNNLDMTNLDLYVSKTFGIHWSFGVVLCLNPEKCLKVLKDTYADERYAKEYIANNIGINIDWFYTFLRDIDRLKMGTFYIENAMVIHMPDIILRPSWAIMMQFRNGYVYYPILETFYKENIFDKREIVPFVEKIDVGIEKDDYSDYLNNYYFWRYHMEFDCLAVAEKRGMIGETYIKNIVADSYKTSGYDDWIRIRSRRNRVKPKRISLLQKIFSIINQDKHKVLRILGIKIKFKRKNVARIKD